MLARQGVQSQRLSCPRLLMSICLLACLHCRSYSTAVCRSSWYPDKRVVTRTRSLSQVLQVSRRLGKHYRRRGGQTRPRTARDEYMGMEMGYMNDGEEIKVMLDGEGACIM
ncbi:uncharacterized protein B0T23DRAFT_103712 [Neurospora hispaniola]|uniref:Secreted protein n=1 Tax=Neurospora hispaniola TaxID=588809 RepID=A0AAJ0I922_9PEZI|nr:hypothetical protein B0T23DRAFT_103712 [Neurospora hispaniola]